MKRSTIKNAYILIVFAGLFFLAMSLFSCSPVVQYKGDYYAKVGHKDWIKIPDSDTLQHFKLAK